MERRMPRIIERECMSLSPEKPLSRLLKKIGRFFLRRLEQPIPSYEQRIINNLDNLYREIRPGDVLLVEGNSRIGRIIQMLTRSAWSHAALYVGNRPGLMDNPHVVIEQDDISETDLKHMLVEADGGNGVIAVPLAKYRDFNIRICRPFGISAHDVSVVVDAALANLGKH